MPLPLAETQTAVSTVEMSDSRERLSAGNSLLDAEFDPNLNLEYLSLLAPIFPLSHEANHDPSGWVCISAEGN